MWLFVLSVVAIGCVQSASVGYPYQTLWSYNPNSQEQNPVDGGSIHGYLRYLDNNKAVGVVGNNKPQPIYAVHQIKYVNNPIPAPAAVSVPINKYDDVSKVREACIRTVTFQQYQHLKRDIDLLRSEGKEPSAVELQKLQTLQKIAFTSDFSLIADLPEVKLTIQELNENINRLYNESVKQSGFVLQSNIQQQNSGEIKTYNGNLNVGLEAIEETIEQRQAREEHLRIYNEQIAQLKQLELEHEKYVKEKEASLKSDIAQKPKEDDAKALAELEKARQEHFRLWNEAKLRAEQAEQITNKEAIYSEVTSDKKDIKIANLKNQAEEQQEKVIDESKSKVLDSVNKDVINNPNLGPQVTAEGMIEIPSRYQPEISLHKSKFVPNLVSIDSSLVYKSQLPLSVVDTPEVAKAREEHLRLVHEANLKAQIVEQQDSKYNHETQSSLSKSQYAENSQSVQSYPTHTVQETPEVIQAREEHFRLVQEAKLKAQIAQQQDSKYKHELQTSSLKSQNDHSQSIHQKLAQETPEVTDPQYSHEFHTIKPTNTQFVQETPEVIQAREEHFRLVQEAKLKAQLAEQQESSNKQNSQVGVLKSPYEHSQFFQSSPAHIVQETPEVVQAREEHFRLVQEAKLKAQLAEQQETKYKHESQASVLKSQYDNSEFIPSQPAQIVQETPEVVQAREEHLRLVNKAKLNANLANLNEKRIVFPSQEQQQSNAAQIVDETPEVQKAREEHLRIFNAIKTHAEQEQNKLKQIKVVPDIELQQKSLEYSSEEEKALLELERIREIERLQKEKQQLELEHVREAERLAEEKRVMDAELLRLKLEDEQRLVMERFVEARRLQEEEKELEKLKNGDYQEEIIIQNEPAAQQPQAILFNAQPLEISQNQQIIEATGQYSNNPFLKVDKVSSGPVKDLENTNNPFFILDKVSSDSANRLEHPLIHQNSQYKVVPVQHPATIYQHSVLNSNPIVHSSDNTVSAARRVPSSHHTTGNKHQHIHDDNIKPNKYYPNIASPLPADTAVALSALERATNEHFRAHEQALEQLRLARLQNSAAKDCN